MKRGYLITVIILVLIFSLGVYVFQTFNMSTPPTYITEHSLGAHGSIRFVYINSSLSASYIQVRKIDKNTNKEYLLESYEHYDNLVGYNLRANCMTVFLRKGYLISSQSSNVIECDTFHLNINNIKWKIK